MQGILSFDNSSRKRRKALRACRRCKEAKKRCDVTDYGLRCRRCHEDALPCSFEDASMLPSPTEPRRPAQHGSDYSHPIDCDSQLPVSPQNENVYQPGSIHAPPEQQQLYRNDPLIGTLTTASSIPKAPGNLHRNRRDSQSISEALSDADTQGRRDEQRYATMLGLLEKKTTEKTSASRQPTKLISGTNPLSALLRKELKHKIVTNSCSFRTPDPSNGANRPSVRRGGSTHSCDWGQFYRSLGVSEARLQYLRSIRCFELPSPSHCAELLEIYFAHVHPLLPVLDRKDFLSRYYGGGEPPPLIILQAVFLAASRYVDNDRRSVDGLSEVRSHCDELHSKLRALIEAEVTSERIAVVQASLLASLHWEGREGVNSAIDNLSLAIRVCQEMGLHRKQVLSAKPSDRELLLRRLWWCSYTLDRFNAAQEGTPFLINEVDCDVEMLSEDDLVDEDQLTCRATLLNLSLARLIEDAVRNLYMPGEDHTTLFTSRGLLKRQTLSLQLEHLAKQIQDQLMSRKDVADCGLQGKWPEMPSLFGVILLTHLDAVRILVHRPFILYQESPSLGLCASREACRSHSLDILSRLGFLQTNDLLRFSWPFTVYALVNCLLIFWYDISSSVSTDRSTLLKARQDYTSVVNLLRIMGTTWWAAAAKHRLAQALARAADELHLKENQLGVLTPETGTIQSNENTNISRTQQGILTPLSTTQSQGYFHAGEWPDGTIFADCDTSDYWGSIGLDFDLDVAGNIFSITDLEGLPS